MATFWHDDKEDTVRAKARCIVQRLPDIGGGGVADDQDVFSTAQVHASVDDCQCAAGHLLFVTHRVFGIFLDVIIGLRWCDERGFAIALRLVDDVLEVLVHGLIVLTVRAFSAKREGRGNGSIQPFFNVCINPQKNAQSSTLGRQRGVEQNPILVLLQPSDIAQSALKASIPRFQLLPEEGFSIERLVKLHPRRTLAELVPSLHRL